MVQRGEQHQGPWIEEKKYVSIGDKERSYESQGDDGQQRRLQGCEKKKIGMDNKSERRAKNKTRKYRDR